VCELLTENLYEKIKDRKQPLPTAQVKSYIYQLCKALEHMHRNGKRKMGTPRGTRLGHVIPTRASLFVSVCVCVRVCVCVCVQAS
jgi:serine/threonine protein kinase